MPTWGEILKEVQASARARGPLGPDMDGLRLKYLQNLHKLTGRAVIAYVSGWLQKNDVPSLSVEPSDVHGLMETCYEVKERELDLVLHSPGGSAEAAEQMLEYLRTQFDYIRAIVPLQAKSAATMMALGCDEILMGDHSELGPIDPQILIPTPEGTRFAPAHAILRDFARAKKECKEDIGDLPAWTPILRSYAGGLIEFCNQQVQLSINVVENWLAKFMLKHPDVGLTDDAMRQRKANDIANWFGSQESYDRFRSHARPMRLPELKGQGLRIKALEDDDALQDAVLSIYHACDLTFNFTPAVKLIENHLGRRKVNMAERILVQQRHLKEQKVPKSREERRRLERGKH